MFLNVLISLSNRYMHSVYNFKDTKQLTLQVTLFLALWAWGCLPCLCASFPRQEHSLCSCCPLLLELDSHHLLQAAFSGC